MIPNELIQFISSHFQGLTGLVEPIQFYEISISNSLNNCRKIKVGETNYFLKWGNAGEYPKMFEYEKEGLLALAQYSGLKIPNVILSYEGEKHSFLLLEWLDEGRVGNGFWENFALNLAKQHKKSFEKFGWNTDNYIGRLSQRNHWDGVWNDFFWTHRIEPQLKIARNNGLADRSDAQLFEDLYYKMDDLVPTESPSLLHGDLWKGNFMVNQNGLACVFDPAVYYGNREVDLAMCMLFGGFPNEFFAAYQQAFPMEKGWDERFDIWNLYPLLVHANMFGDGFLNEARRNIRRFI